MASRFTPRSPALATAGLLALAALLWLFLGADQNLAVGTQSSAAREAYRKAREVASGGSLEDLQEAIPHLRRAIQADTSFAQAYVMLADLHVKLGRSGVLPPKECFQTARAAILQALNLNDRSGEALAIHGAVIMDYLWGWQEAERYMRLALELAPDHAPAHLYYAELLIRLRRFDEALQHAEKGRALDPDSPAGEATVAMVRYFARQSRDAVPEPPRDPDPVASLMRLGSTPQEAETALSELERRREQGYVSPYLLAAVHAQLGEPEEVFRWLTTAIEGRDPLLGLLAVDPAIDPVRDDPRLANLVDYMDLPL